MTQTFLFPPRFIIIKQKSRPDKYLWFPLLWKEHSGTVLHLLTHRVCSGSQLLYDAHIVQWQAAYSPKSKTTSLKWATLHLGINYWSSFFSLLCCGYNLWVINVHMRQEVEKLLGLFFEPQREFCHFCKAWQDVLCHSELLLYKLWPEAQNKHHLKDTSLLFLRVRGIHRAQLSLFAIFSILF